MKIAAISDIHGNLKYLEKASGKIKEADLILIAGDITKGGSKEEAEDVISGLKKYNENILAVHGNWDRDEVREYLEQQGIDLHAGGRIIGETGFLGVGGASPIPILSTATEYTEDEIYNFAVKGYRVVNECKRILLISHTPPRGIRDRTFLGLRGGSKSIRRFLEEKRINACICGHIHEARGYEYLNNQLIVNTGSFKKGDFTLITLNEDIEIKQERL